MDLWEDMSTGFLRGHSSDRRRARWCSGGKGAFQRCDRRRGRALSVGRARRDGRGAESAAERLATGDVRRAKGSFSRFLLSFWRFLGRNRWFRSR